MQPRKIQLLADKTLEETKDLVTCCICVQKYNNEAYKPKILACFHTFCLECVEVN